jgi:hypothetical protein
MSLFNPWILLGILMAVLSAAGSGYYKGQHDENTRQQVEIAGLNAIARTKEAALTTAVTSTATALRTSNEKAKQISKERDLAIASGALRLRLPVKAPVCPVHTATDTPAESRDSVQASAELDGETAKSLVAITDQGDANTRQLNACIDAYNAVYQTLKGTK